MSSCSVDNNALACFLPSAEIGSSMWLGATKGAERLDMAENHPLVVNWVFQL
jgi:hypothetical protein